MSERKEYKLSSLMDIIGGGTPKTSIKEYWDGNIPWLSVVDFNTGRKFVIDTEKKITELGLKESSTKYLEAGDIIISARGTVGALAVLEKPMTFNQSCYGLKAKKGITKNSFLYYLIKDTISEFSNHTYGAVFDTITKESFDNILILLPTLIEQERIAEILSSLDDKIDLLHRNNKTLEDLAETLFRQWFNNETETKPVIYFGKIVCGKTPSKTKSDFFDGPTPFLKIPDMHGKTFVFKTTDSLTEIGKKSQLNKTLPPFSISVSCIATVGLVTINASECQTNQQINSIIPNKEYFRYYLFNYFKSITDDLIQRASSGSVTHNLNTGDFSNIEIPYFNDNLLKSFDDAVSPLYQKIFKNEVQRLERSFKNIFT